MPDGHRTSRHRGLLTEVDRSQVESPFETDLPHRLAAIYPADHWYWQGNATRLADRKANISSFGVRSRRRPRFADCARAQRRAGAAAPLAAVDGRLDDGQPRADGAYLFWPLVCALGMLILGHWGPETKGVPMERMEELFSGPWWKQDLERQGRPRGGTAVSQVLVLGEGLGGEGQAFRAGRACVTGG
ncbi:hypothetical protein DL768_002486 [Monosporascus sp. mg162]|nr:hypothetical protein DL768_002486 [Monosporascus sp. mg162]